MKQDVVRLHNSDNHASSGPASEIAGENDEEPPGISGCLENVVPLPEVAPRLRGKVSVFPTSRSRPASSPRSSAFRRAFFPSATDKEWTDWQWQIRNRVRHLDQLERMLALSDPERTAIEKIQSADFDMILMDIHMPVMDGFDATRQIRKIKGLKSNVPIMAMTANVLKAEVDKCYEVGMNGYIAKPFERDDLLDQINKVLELQKNL